MDDLIRQLKRWQTCERLMLFAWGFARFTAVIAVGLFVCCFVDWLVDRYRETPFLLRLAMTTAQIVALVAGAYWFLLKVRAPSLDALAGRAEEQIAEFDHRLVTALQLNRPSANTNGMSPELIRAVTTEAEALAARHRLLQFLDYEPGKWALAVLVPLAVIAFGCATFKGPLTRALLARQCLLNVDIPRSIALEPETAELWPSGDEVVLQFRVTGKYDPDAVGSVRVRPEGQPSEDYQLRFSTHDGDNAAIYTATVPPSSKSFTYRGWLQDGRSRTAGQVHFEPRPVVEQIQAEVILPEYVGKTPSGHRYTRFMQQAEVVALADSEIRVDMKASKPVVSADVVLFARDESGKEVESRRVAMKLANETDAQATFTLPPRPTAYRIEVVDRNGFKNANPPRRGITLAPDDPPHVQLLAEVLKDPRDPGPLDDYDVTGMPLVPGGQVQVGYFARSPLGIQRVRIAYRVNEGEWTFLPLKLTVVETEKLGRFVPELGVFENSGPFGQVEFYPIPSRDFEVEPNGLEAGGRYSFQTAALTKTGPDGKPKKLDLGDRVEFYVDAFDRNPAEGRQPGRSESRIKTVVSQSQLDEWNRQRVQTSERLRTIEERQRGIFVPGKNEK
ncbi:MAG: hypothetical protein U0798_14395 [Gemmataceae bacterium]